MSTKSYVYEALGTSIVDIYTVIADHFTNNSFHHEVQFSTSTGIIVRPKVAPAFHSSIRRSSSTQFSLQTDRLMGFTAAGSVVAPPSGGSAVVSPEIISGTLSFGSTAVLISEEVDHFYIFTFSDLLKKSSNLGIACGYGYLPLAANDPDFGTTGLWSLNGSPSIRRTSITNSWSVSIGYVETMGGWARSSFEEGFGSVSMDSVSLPRNIPLYGFGAGDSSSTYYLVGTTKYAYKVIDNYASRTRLESASQSYLYINDSSGNTFNVISWETGVIP